MKKIISTLLLLSFITTLTTLSYVADAQIAIGSRSEEVKVIQEILKTDPEIYPQGLVTGYYGSLTQNAIKKLQKKCGIPETGIVDDATEKCIYPIDYQVRVVYPNGGEVLDRNQIHTVKWEVIEPEVSIPERPLWSKASLDLFRRIQPQCLLPEGCGTTATTTSVFVKHIATVNLFDRAYSGRITADIPNGKDYVIRISVGAGIGTLWYREKNEQPLPSTGEIWPVPPRPPLTSWDESDATFEITGEIKPACPKLEEVIAILEKTISELQRAVALLKSTQ